MQTRITLAIVLTALLATAARAQTAEEQQLCMDDAFRVCSTTIPDRTRTIACMVANKSQLSRGCQMVMDKYAPGSQVRTASAVPMPPAKPARATTRPGKPLKIQMR
jgi:hypothetical protein